MTEAEWLAATDPSPLLESMMGKGFDRKLRLFAVGCCRKVWDRLANHLSRTAIEVAEDYADGGATADDLQRARQLHRSCDLHRTQGNAANAVLAASLLSSSSGIVSLESALEASKYAAKASTDKEDGGKRKKDSSWLPLWNAARTEQLNILREIFGNPFRPVAVDLSWLTSDVLALAHGVYKEKAFDRLPILADALQDAGCDSDDLLNHLRSDGPHVKGCWALDLMLGKS